MNKKDNFRWVSTIQGLDRTLTLLTRHLDKMTQAPLLGPYLSMLKSARQ